MVYRSKYAIGERILCSYGPLLYEAKCVDVEVIDKEPKYFVHYNGWNKSWDEWVDENRLLKYNSSNVQKLEELKKQHIKEKKPRRKSYAKKETSLDKKDNSQPQDSAKELSENEKCTNQEKLIVKNKSRESSLVPKKRGFSSIRKEKDDAAETETNKKKKSSHSKTSKQKSEKESTKLKNEKSVELSTSTEENLVKEIDQYLTMKRVKPEGIKNGSSKKQDKNDIKVKVRSVNEGKKKVDNGSANQMKKKVDKGSAYKMKKKADKGSDNEMKKKADKGSDNELKKKADKGSDNEMKKEVDTGKRRSFLKAKFTKVPCIKIQSSIKQKKDDIKEKGVANEMKVDKGKQKRFIKAKFTKKNLSKVTKQ